MILARRQIRKGLGSLLAAALVVLPGRAGFAADAEAGRQKAQACTLCHGPQGNSTNALVPSLAGQPAQFITTELFQYREGNRKNLQMTQVTAQLSNADLNDLAAYFSAQKAASPKHGIEPAKAAAGRRLSELRHCVQCHGPGMMGLQHIPRLAGQQRKYLLAQLRGFKAGVRADIDGNMTAAAQGLSEPEIQLLAEYLSALRPPS
ncbi:MAG: c-type cytochrome [Myxococcales bacterium]